MECILDLSKTYAIALEGGGAKGAYEIGAVTFSNVYGYLGETDEARKIIDSWVK